MSIVEVVRKSVTTVDVAHPGVQGPTGPTGPTGGIGPAGPAGPAISDHYTTHVIQGIQ